MCQTTFRGVSVCSQSPFWGACNVKPCFVCLCCRLTQVPLALALVPRSPGVSVTIATNSADGHHHSGRRCDCHCDYGCDCGCGVILPLILRHYLGHITVESGVERFLFKMCGTSEKDLYLTRERVSGHCNRFSKRQRSPGALREGATWEPTKEPLLCTCAKRALFADLDFEKLKISPIT